MLRQQAQENARGPPRGQILELPAADGNPGPSQGHLNFYGGHLTVEGIPVLGLVDTGASVTCMGFAIWWRYHAQWGALKQF